MEHVLKGWLADNTITTEEKDDKILVLESSGSLTMDDVLDKMIEKYTGLRRETLAHAVDLFQNTLVDLLLAGYSINTGMVRMVPQFRGVVKDGVWNPKENSIYVLFQQDKALREAIAKTVVKILGKKQEPAYILSSEDTATRAMDGTATAGRTFRIRGKKIRMAGDDPNVGFYIVDSKKTETKLEKDMIVQNDPSTVVLLLPSDLAEGDYELRIVTQFSSGTTMLKTPRTLTQSFTIGSGGGAEDPTA